MHKVNLSPCVFINYLKNNFMQDLILMQLFNKNFVQIFSDNLPGSGITEIGLQFPTFRRSPHLGIDVTLAMDHTIRKIPVIND